MVALALYPVAVVLGKITIADKLQRLSGKLLEDQCLLVHSKQLSQFEEFVTNQHEPEDEQEQQRQQQQKQEIQTRRCKCLDLLQLQTLLTELSSSESLPSSFSSLNFSYYHLTHITTKLISVSSADSDVKNSIEQLHSAESAQTRRIVEDKNPWLNIGNVVQFISPW